MMSLRVMSPVGRVALSQVVPPSPQQVEEVCVCACMCVCMCVRVCMCVSVCAYLKVYVLMEESNFHYIRTCIHCIPLTITDLHRIIRKLSC